MFHLVTGLLALIVCARLIWILPVGLPLKLLLCVLTVVATQYHQALKRWFGGMAAPDVPGWVLMLAGWGLGSVLIAAVLVLVLDVAGMLSWLVSRPLARTLLTVPVWRAGIGVLAMLAGAVAVWQAVRVPEVKRLEVPIAGLDPALDGFRLVQLSDLHASRLLQRPWMQAVVDRTNALAPDLIVITGDLVDGSVSARQDDVAPLRELRAVYGVWGVPGNHEFYSLYQPWHRHFVGELGIRMLVNGHALIAGGMAPAAARQGPAVPVEGGAGEKDPGKMPAKWPVAGFVLAGLSDSAAWPYRLPIPDLEAALEGAPADVPVILMAHRPAGAREHARRGVALQLSGHTHGGQVWLMHWVVQRFNEGFVSGLYPVGQMLLYVSHGTGLWAGFPLRLGKPSEITEFTLRSAAR
ncbi:MAG: metallophosphoesterase [Lautropia sp.]|nr:metallophosphoesterase [Lautropia sp.]